MTPESTGICPNCGKRTGAVGERCPVEVCHDKGYAFIPKVWYDAAREFASRKQRPLDPLLGRSIDRYLLAGKIGEGGMGSVYLAIQRPLKREVALKVISGLEMTQATIARFEREARAISVLDHPNIVKLYDYGVGELEFRVPYMALEYVKHGRTLRRAFAQMRQDSGGAPIPGEVVLSVFRQVLHALNAAHGVGIIHRDMKPENVMLAPVSGNPYFVKVLDFGLAKAVADVSGFDGTVSRTGQFLGTPVYMAPEQAPRKGQPLADHRADLYAVAVMLFEVFTGVRPFEGETVIEVLTKKMDPAHDPCGYPEARILPRSLRAFLSRGMAVDPGARFGSAEEMLSAFEGALSGRRATAVGLAGGRPGSSDERPATPESPAPADEAVMEPTRPLGDSAADAAVWREVASSTVGRPRRSKWRRWLVVVAALVAASAVMAGIWLSAGSRPGPGHAPEPVPQAAPSAPQPTVEPARAAEPVPQAAPSAPQPTVEPARAAEPVPAAGAERAAEPVPAAAPAAVPVAAPAEAPRAVAAPARAPVPERAVGPAPPRAPARRPVLKQKAPEPVPQEKPKRL